MAHGESIGANPQPQMADATSHSPGMSRNAWIAAGVIIFVALIAALAARTFLRGDTRTLTLPGDLTPTQVAALKALEESFRDEAMRQSPTLTAEQVGALQRLEANP